MLIKEQKRELTIDTMASWALDGLLPDRQTVKDINAYVEGEMTLEELIEKSKAL